MNTLRMVERITSLRATPQRVELLRCEFSVRIEDKVDRGSEKDERAGCFLYWLQLEVDPCAISAAFSKMDHLGGIP